MRYTVKKLTAFLFTMVVVSLLTFIAFDLISGDPAQAMLGTEATPEKLAALREQLAKERQRETRREERAARAAAETEREQPAPEAPAADSAQADETN